MDIGASAGQDIDTYAGLDIDTSAGLGIDTNAGLDIDTSATPEELNLVNPQQSIPGGVRLGDQETPNTNPNPGGVEQTNMSKTRILIHTVFCTKNRYQTLPLLHKRELYRYLHGILNAEKCHTIRINGMTEHVHLFFDLNPSVALASLVKKLKTSSSLWMKNSPYFGLFEGWNEGYYAASVGPTEEEMVKQYIISQEEHHGGKGLIEEMKEMAMKYHLDWDDRDWGSTPPGL